MTIETKELVISEELKRKVNDNKKYKNNKLKISIITLDLSNIKSVDGKQIFKRFFEKFKEICENI